MHATGAVLSPTPPAAVTRTRSPRPAVPAAVPNHALKGPRPLEGPDLSDRDLRGAAFGGLDLEGADFRKSDLRGADLRGSDLFGARLDGADLRGCRLDMTRLVEIELPRDLPLALVNQIRRYDFVAVMPRRVPAAPTAALPCPYRDSALRPLLYEWGSRTWNGGAGWTPPERGWTLEQIIAGVLDALGCRHDLAPPPRREACGRSC